MKKIILIFSLVLCLTGCSIEKIDTSDKDNLIGYMTSKDYKLYNRFSIGYKYYLPKSVALINYGDYNEQLMSNGDIYYLYIDITSYYYKKELNIDKYDNAVYYKQIKNDNKEGYIKVNNHDDERYYVIYQYNYAKIEAIIDKNNLDNTLINMSYILSSLTYNDSILESLIDDSNDISKEETFELEKPNNNGSTFLDYVNTYDNYDGNENKIDEETINTNDTE